MKDLLTAVKIDVHIIDDYAFIVISATEKNT